MSFADYLENKRLDHVTGTSFSAPSALYLGLSTTTPNDDGTGVTEPSSGGYTRALIEPGDWSAAAAGVKENGVAIVFTTPSADWGTITHWVLYDAVTSGNMIAFGELATSRTVVGGVAPKFAVGALLITLD